MKTKVISKSKSNGNNKGFIFDIIKGTLISVIVSLIAVLILALIVKLTAVGESVILPINQVIKVCSILLGCIFGIKGAHRGLFKGALIGLFYALLSMLIFLILNISSPIFNFIDVLANTVSGAICGLIAVKFTKK